MSGLDPRTLDPLVRHACEEAVRSRLREIESSHVDDRRRLTAKRASLDLLHFAVSAGGTVDRLQIHLLLELLDAQDRAAAQQALPAWPGAQYAFLTELLDARHATAEARRVLREALEAQAVAQ